MDSFFFLLFLITVATQAEPPTRAEMDLYNAVFVDNVEQVEAAIKAGADFNIVYSNGQTPLMMAAVLGSVPVVKLLLERGAKTTILSADGVTALQQAFFAENEGVVRAFVEHGGDVDRLDPELGTNPLVEAINWGELPIIQMLLEMGANVNAVDGMGVNPLRSAAMWGRKDVMEVLLSRGALTNERGDDQETALMIVILSRGSPQDIMEMFNLLLAHSANVNLQDKHGYTALMYVVTERQEHVEFAGRLIQAGANIHLTDTYGYTALMFASRQGHLRIVQLLLGSGADVTAETPWGETAVGMAENEGIRELLYRALSVAHTEFHPHAAAARRLKARAVFA